MADGGASQNQALLVTAVASLLGGGGISALIPHIFGREKIKAEAAAIVQKSFSDMANMLLEQDQARIKQMSDALSAQSTKLAELIELTGDQATRIDKLRSAVETLVGHITSLETIMRSKKMDPPPRPAIGVID